MSDLNVALILRLVDQVTAPSRAVIGAVRDIGDATERAGRAGVAWSDRQLAANMARRQALQSEAMGVAATGFALYQAMRPAVEFETAMAGVRRVVDFDTPEGLAAMQRDILDLTTSGGLPMAAEGIAAIIEAAGQAGVIDNALPDAEERAQLLAFAQDAAQMGTAFDISAENAGASMALWRVTLGMSRDEALAFGDAINYLSNNMDASAPGIVEMVRRNGAFAQAAGLSQETTVALSAAFLAGGAAPQVAATGMQNLITTMTAGAAATDVQREVFQRLGLDAEEMAERMQVDAQGAIYDVMTALADLPEYTQIAALTQIFGRESADAIAPLLANLGLLDQAFGLVAEPADYAGSMLEEFRVQTETTANALRITMNFVRAMSVFIGSVLLPELNALFKAIQPIITSITDWAAAHPELIQLIARVALGMLAFRAASIALRWGLLSALVPVLQLIRGGSWLIAILPRVAAGLLALLNPLAWVRGAIWAIRMAFIASGIGLLLAGIAAAGLWIYNNWSGLKIFFVNLWTAFRKALGPAAPILNGILNMVQRLGEWLLEILGPLDATEAEWRGWGVAVGEAIGGAIAGIFDWTGANRGLIGSLAKIMALLVVLRAVWIFPMAPVRAVGRLFAWLARGPLIWVLGGLRLIGGAILWIGRLALANPIGLAVTAIAALAYAVYDNWAAIVTWFREKVEVVRAAFEEGLLNGVFAALAEFNPFTLAAEGLQGLIAYVMELVGVPEEIVEAFADFSLWDTGVTLIQSLWDGMRSLVTQLVADITSYLAGIMPQWALDFINGNIQRGGLPPSQYVNPVDEFGDFAGRDAGGPVRAGQPYLVGERGREMFIPGVSGSIVPTRVIRAAMAAAALSAPVAAAADTSFLETRLDRRPALSAPVQQQQGNTTIEVGQIVIQAAPGMDPAAIGREVRRQLQALQDDRRGDLHDGVDF